MAIFPESYISSHGVRVVKNGRRRLLMDCNKLTSVSHMGGEAAVGADSSRPSPQRSEAKRVSIPSAPAEWPDYFVKSHQSARKMPGACVEEQKYGRAQRMFMWRNTKVWRCCVSPFRFITNAPKEKMIVPPEHVQEEASKNRIP